MTKYLYIQAIGVMLAVLLVCLAGCSIRDQEILEEESMYNDIYLNISLEMDYNDSYTRANRPEEDESFVNGTVNENAINTIQLLWKVSEDWKVVEVNEIDLQENKTIKVVLSDDEFYSLDGMEMWLGANLNSEQIEAFKTSSAYSLRNTISWADELAPMYSDFVGRNDIAMFCVKSAVPTPVSSSEREYSISFKLKRLVAKVLVTCKEDENNKGYVPLVSNDERPFEGWIKLSDVYYSLNGVNKSTYIKQFVREGTDYDNNVMDTNPYLYDYTSLYNEKDQTQYLNIVNRDFYNYGITELLLKGSMYKPTKPFDRNESYTEGFYCPENTFFYDNNKDDAAKLESCSSSWGMITNVSVMARFTPKILNVEGGVFDFILESGNEGLEKVKTTVGNIKESLEKNGGIDEAKVYEVDCIDENVAKAFLKYSLVFNGFLSDEIMTDNGFQDETYFYHDELNKYYTYGAAKISYGSAVNTTELGNYQPYYDGWGFYYTYIDNRLDKSGEDFTFYKHGQVERNRYYVITINSFSNPGSSSVEPKYVEVNTDIIPWKNGGSGSITLE